MLVTYRCDGAILSDRCGDGLSAVGTQPVRRYIELRTPVNRESRDRQGEGERQSEKVDKKRILLLTHRCDGAILSDRCGHGLSAVRTQAVRRYIELLTNSVERKQGTEE